MKKLLIKAETIDVPFSPFVPEKWVKDGVEVFEQPTIEVDGVQVADDSYTYHPAIPEVAEVKSWKVIDQTQGPEEELQVWLSGNIHKYPEGYWVEYIDITDQVNQEKIDAEALKYLADTDWLIIREVDAGISCPQEIKQLRAEARLRIVR
jgi:hypothetical protein